MRYILLILALLTAAIVACSDNTEINQPDAGQVVTMTVCTGSDAELMFTVGEYTFENDSTRTYCRIEQNGTDNAASGISTGGLCTVALPGEAEWTCVISDAVAGVCISGADEIPLDCEA